MTISEKQAQKLKVKKRTQWSPYLEKCCLLLSANESYKRAEEDLKVLTGIEVSHSTQHRMVHRKVFRLALELLNQQSNKLDEELKFQVLNGIAKMFLRFFIIDALISMAISLPN